MKIDLGCHFDGYIAVAAHTLVVKESPDDEAPKEVDSELGNVAVAAYNAMLVAAHSIAAGKTNKDVTASVERVAKAYNVTPISSVRMHQMKRHQVQSLETLNGYLHSIVGSTTARAVPQNHSWPGNLW